MAVAVAEAERQGFGVAWVPDSQFLWRDVWAALALSAAGTGTIRLGTCVTNLETRHPSVTAAAAATIDELAPGRFILGVGTGDSALKTLGLAPTPLADMAGRIDAIRALLAGDDATFGDRTMRLRTVPRRPVPIYMAANGPRSLALAGERGDGAIVLTGFQPGLISATRDTIARGAQRAGRAVTDIDICVGAICHITNDPAHAAHIVRPYVVATAQTGGQHTLRAIGIDIDPPPVIAGIYPDMSHAEDWDTAAAAATRWVDDRTALRYADAYCLIGSIDHCTQRILDAIQSGATSFYLRHPDSYTLPHHLLHTFGHTIIPQVRQATTQQ